MNMKAPVISYEPFERLIVSLRADRLEKDADRLHHLIHKVAWTTSSELMGELGKEIHKLNQEPGKEFSSSSRHLMEEALETVAQVWPRFHT